jgi:hypothetical protein
MSAFISPDRYFDPESERLSAYFSKLFILIGKESLQYCILDTDKNTFVALADFRLSSSPKTPELFYAEISKLILQENALKKKYASVVLGIDTPLHTLVPVSLFDSGQNSKYLEFNFGMNAYGQVKADQLEEIDAYNVYGIPQDLMDLINLNYGEAALFHRSSAWIRAIYNHQKISPGSSVMYMNVREQIIDLAYMEGTRLGFFNSYSCASKEDVLYYTLYAIEQLNLRPDNLHLFVSGMIDTDSELQRLLEQYTNQVSLWVRPDIWNYSPLLYAAPAHRYQELYALALCGS